MPFFMKTKRISILVCIAALASAISAAIYVDAVTSDDIRNMQGPMVGQSMSHNNVASSSSSSVDSNRLIIVSTMDGKVSALDESEGTLMWTIDAGIGPLVSSSITKLQINQDGKVIRLIPSLSGGLFKFDGNSIEALPFSADQLLSSSFKVSDGSILIGDNEVTTFGVDANSGSIVYYCTAAVCDFLAKASPDAHIIVVKRHQKTVRSVGNRNGKENWNFSVGEIHLDISEGVSNQLVPMPQETETKDEQNKDKKDFTSSVNLHWSDDEHDDMVDEFGSGEWTNSQKKTKIKLSVPDGMIFMYNSESHNKPTWKYKFSSPIASGWHVEGGKFRKVDLFDPKSMPALHEEGNTIKDDPTIYLGFYESHAYIQVSRILKRATGTTALSVLDHLTGHKSAVHTIKFYFHPYLATSDRLTEAVVGEAKEGEIAIYGSSDTKGSCSDKQGVYIDTSGEKDSEIGYYFKCNMPYYSLLPESERKGKGTEIDPGDSFFETFQIGVIYPHLLHWWKEVLFISVVTSILVHVFISKVIKTSVADAPSLEPSVTKPFVEQSEVLPSTHNVTSQYPSRYLHDFEPVRCLGKGGFGIVLESRNKVDTCSYAVKRIRLPIRQSAREKVLREVRTLAKLNHHCIVRYFNAWIEEPPSGWQEKVDRDIIKEVCTFPSSAGISSSLVPSKVTYGKQHAQQSFSKINMPLGRSQISADTYDALSEGSRPFSFISGPFHDGGDWNSRNFSEISGSRSKFSFLSSSEDTNTFADGENIPFERYAKQDDSHSIVFEDTGARASTDSAIEEDAFDMPGSGKELSKGSFLKQRSSSKKVPNKEMVTKSTVHSSPSDAVENMQPINIHVNVYLYIQMELCQKESLRTWLANNHERKDDYCLWIFNQVLSAVEYVHGGNLIHRDLKPSNIFFSFNGAIKVGDFGLVTETDELCNKDFEVKESFTKTNASGEECSHTEKVGTILYMAPEQMNGRMYNQKVDIFALGLILVELLMPFSTQMERFDVLMKSRDGKMCKSFETAYNNEADLARRMLSRNPSLRPTATEAMEDKVFYSSTQQLHLTQIK